LSLEQFVANYKKKLQLFRVVVCFICFVGTSLKLALAMRVIFARTSWGFSELFAELGFSPLLMTFSISDWAKDKW
jgi:hypothetical protein